MSEPKFPPMPTVLSGSPSGAPCVPCDIDVCIVHSWKDRAEKAEARVAELEATLKEIRHFRARVTTEIITLDRAASQNWTHERRSVWSIVSTELTRILGFDTEPAPSVSEAVKVLEACERDGQRMANGERPSDPVKFKAFRAYQDSQRAKEAEPGRAMQESVAGATPAVVSTVAGSQKSEGERVPVPSRNGGGAPGETSRKSDHLCLNGPKREPVVWADEIAPVTGPEVKALLEENERLRARPERLSVGGGPHRTASRIWRSRWGRTRFRK